MSRKLLLDPYLAIHGKIMAKNGHFSWNFDLFLTFFIDCDHIYVPNGKIWGSTSRPHIGDMMMSLFFTLGSTVHDWGWPKNGPFWTKKGQTWQACQHSKVVQKGSERSFLLIYSAKDARHLFTLFAYLLNVRIDILFRVCISICVSSFSID